MLFNALLLSSTALLARAANFDVRVGGLEGGNPVLKFNPEFVNANVGDTVTFHFAQRNHSVVETSFNSVCQPLLNEQHVPTFSTQFHPVANDETNFPTEVYTVTDASKPLWFYCSQKSHCGKGMIFSINCPTTGENTLDAFRQRALAIGAAEAAASSSAAAWSSTASPDVYGGQTYPPVYHPTVTRTVTFQTETWTTTYESYENSPEPTPVAEDGIVHTVLVGANGSLAYDPPSIQANVRDTVRFVFKAKNHTITQSSFGDPCRKLEFTSTTGQVGFDSGFVPGKDDNSAFFDVKVNETGPIWAYCRQGNHCGQGMVFAINADESSARNFAAFQALAKTINGTGSNNGNTAGNGSPGAGFATASVVGGLATLVLVGFGSVAAVMF
ncbi:SubName: Full=Uncharacterized protein {ECO:0000313/EMBL:CCA69287.1} [Serendipita indica DSM 11827]|nr:SubName: Full=Uncharacterized protein {ECO:0000313/EMBL:CCA69287.1} [Serendipita indica DSM 11827]